MGIKKQFDMIKNNWLMIVLGLLALVFLSDGQGIVSQSFDDLRGMTDSLDKGMGMYESNSANYYSGTSVSGDFAPEVEERKIVKSSSLSSETSRGEFKGAEDKLKNIISSSDAYLLNERVNRNGEGWRSYYYGYYSIKVDVDKYDAVVAQLKEIGEVKSFSENMNDVTGRYEDISVEIEVEKTRLARYLDMYENAEIVSDQIELNDRIFDEERKIKYLENSLANIDNRIDYSTVSFSLTEEKSDWTDIVFVKFSSLIGNFVKSVNNLLSFIFGVIPWAIVAWIGWFFWKRFRKTN